MGELCGRAALTLAALGAAAAAHQRQRPFLSAGAPHVALLGYLALVALSAATRPNTYGTWQASMTATTLASAFFTASYLASVGRGNAILRLILGLTAFHCLYGLIQAVHGGWTVRYLPSRISSIYFNSNHYSGFLVLVLPLCLSFALYARPKALRRMGLGLALAAGVNLGLTFSWGLVAALPPLVGLVARSSKRRVAAALLLALGLLSLVVTPQLSGTPQQRLRALGERYLPTSVLSRAVLARSALKLTEQQPLLGVGPGNFVYAVTRYRPATSERRADLLLHQRLNYAHNDYVHIAAETGLVSLGMYLLFWTLILCWPTHLETARGWGLKAGVCALLLHGLSDGNLSVVAPNALLAYLFAGLISASDTSLAKLAKVERFTSEDPGPSGKLGDL